MSWLEELRADLTAVWGKLLDRGDTLADELKPVVERVEAAAKADVAADAPKLEDDVKTTLTDAKTDAQGLAHDVVAAAEGTETTTAPEAASDAPAAS